jgi:hypothetical protein
MSEMATRVSTNLRFADAGEALRGVMAAEGIFGRYASASRSARRVSCTRKTPKAETHDRPSL